MRMRASINKSNYGMDPGRPNPVRTQEAYNIDMCFETCTRVQTLTNGNKFKWVLTGCRGAEV